MTMPTSVTQPTSNQAVARLIPICDVCRLALTAEHMAPENWHGPDERTAYMSGWPRGHR